MKLNENMRKLLASYVNKEIDKIEPMDIVQEFETDKIVFGEMKKLGGDIFTNPQIKEFDDETVKLVEMMIRNLKNHVNQFMPLILTELSEHDVKGRKNDG